MNSLRDELSLRHNSFLAKIQKQESEISRLRSQLSAAATPNSEVETRLSSLTRTLVLKQQELEHLTTDRNALRLQLEKLEVQLYFSVVFGNEKLEIVKIVFIFSTNIKIGEKIFLLAIAMIPMMPKLCCQVF